MPGWVHCDMSQTSTTSRAHAAGPGPQGTGAGPHNSDNVRSACRLNTSIPHPTCCTYNISSASAYPRDLKGRLRKAKVDNQLERLGASSEILCLQETQLLELDSASLGHSLKTHILYYNNATLARRGGSPPVSLGPSPPASLSSGLGWARGWKAGYWC